jgi:arylsulfatase/arylsulfatase A
MRISRTVFAQMISVMRTLLVTVLGMAFAPAAEPIPSPSGSRPNIIIVMPDDMGYGDLGVTGNPVIRTPHLDQFASESAELTSFHVSPVCSPTRACLLTGRYNHRTRVIDTFKGRSMMEPAEVTLAEVLKEAGYTTGIFGKWHLGDNHPLRPQDQGFDEVLVHRGGGLAQPSEPIANARRYTNPILFHNGKEVHADGYCTDVYFEAAMEFIADAADREVPFLAYVAPNAPHGPYHDVPPDLLKYYQSIDLDPVLLSDRSASHGDTVARVFAMVENIDDNMGRLDAFLAEQGLKQNTIVLFFTDNGPNTMRYVGPFRGKKGQVHDGGIRTCFYARWPGEFPQGHRNDRIAAHIDIMPTLLEAVGIAAPAGIAFDGKSVLPLLKGSPGDWPDRTLVIQSHRGDKPVAEHHIAVRSQEWKLIHATGFHREDMQEDVPFELYRSMDDPGEQHDLAEEHPERVAELRRAYALWLADVSSTRPLNFAPPRITIGAAEEPVTDLSIQDWRVSPRSEGWGAGGVWHVSVLSPGPYEVKVHFDSPPGARALDVMIGDRRVRARLEDGATSVSVGPVSLPIGDTTVRMEATPEFTVNSIPRFVIFRRK